VLYRADATLALARHYLDYAEEQLGSYVIGPEGVPWVPVYGNWVEHPDLVAQWGLRQYAYGHRRPLMVAAHWLAHHERVDGGIPYLFTLQDGGGVAEFAPWISALSQGQAISELMRAYQVSGSSAYLRAALHALNPFLHLAPAGVTSWWSGHRWYEEYPAAQSQCFHVLNGFMFALVGLHDLAPRSLTAWRLWRAGVRGLIAHVQSFDVPDQRSQFYTGLGPDHVPVDAYYAQTDAVLIRQIARWTHNGLLSNYARRWTSYTR
jgi:heparosan-N-sulfate-glucuronate 5-epimerase